ncbi:MAG TPA: hypothetical protein VK422_23450 [Pyrinomonadaceae bacterium]|nr:hypothetical protein [Pyrinomonadaceae bacterium]
MSDWIGLGLLVLLVVGAVVGLSHLGRKPEPLTEEEYEQRVAEGRGMMSAGVIGLQKILDPATERAVAAIQDLKSGYYDDQEEEGEGDEPGAAKRRKATDEEGDDV